MSPGAQFDFPMVPYVLWILDGGLANYAGVSPHEPIGEPDITSWGLFETVLGKGYDVVILTWRDPGLVYAWIERAKLQDLVMRPEVYVQSNMPAGLPVAWVTGRTHEEFGRAVALPSRRKTG
jgi:hypothetical protein